MTLHDKRRLSKSRRCLEASNVSTWSSATARQTSLETTTLISLSSISLSLPLLTSLSCYWEKVAHSWLKFSVEKTSLFYSSSLRGCLPRYTVPSRGAAEIRASRHSWSPKASREGPLPDCNPSNCRAVVTYWARWITWGTLAMFFTSRASWMTMMRRIRWLLSHAVLMRFSIQTWTIHCLQMCLPRAGQRRMLILPRIRMLRKNQKIQ